MTGRLGIIAGSGGLPAALAAAAPEAHCIAFEGAEASFRLLVQRTLPDYEPPFELVDLMVMPDGALLLSDYYAGAIYRISYAP